MKNSKIINSLFINYTMYFYSSGSQLQRLIALVVFGSRFQPHRSDFDVISVDSANILRRFELWRGLTDVLKACLMIGRHRTHDFFLRGVVVANIVVF